MLAALASTRSPRPNGNIFPDGQGGAVIRLSRVVLLLAAKLAYLALMARLTGGRI
jgi:hypothetical protein